jgi:superfamily I DNA/RNA helicase
MKKNEVQVGGVYVAMVSNKLTEVRITAIDEKPAYGRIKASTIYRAVNLKTGREVSFRSAQKLRREVKKTIGNRPPTLEGDLKSLAQQGAAGTITAKDQDTQWVKRVNEEVEKRGLASSLREKGVHSVISSAGSTAPHVIVEARAGTGKTTTLIEGLKLIKGMPTSIEPSPQQQAVWDQLMKSKDARSICFVAFNKSIATELQQRVPVGCDAMTMHSMGFKAVKNAFGSVRVTNYRVQDIIARLLGRGEDIKELWKEKFEVMKGTEKLVSLCKMNLIDLSDPYPSGYSADDPCPKCSGIWSSCSCSTESELDRLASHYDVELNGSRMEVYDLVPKVLEKCKDVNHDRSIDFDDMIWLPVALGLPVTKYDLLLVDEAQDLNRCQQALAKKAGRRLVLVGDPYQAIYGFAGADAESMRRMSQELGSMESGCETLLLTVTRRCGKAIVREAQQIVPEFEAHEDNSDGIIGKGSYKGDPGTWQALGPKGQDAAGKLAEMVDQSAKDRYSYHYQVQDGDMLLCRVNAPLVSQCFRFLKAGRKATIQGRDIGQGLISTIKKLKADSVVDLVGKLSEWLHKETEKENARRIPNEGKLIVLQDRHDCLVCFTEGMSTIEEVIARIEAVFTDDGKTRGIRLSSIHKAKGLESRRVFLLEPEGATVPHPMARSAWQKEQEMNLRYVAITRAIEELVYVS